MKAIKLVSFILLLISLVYLLIELIVFNNVKFNNIIDDILVISCLAIFYMILPTLGMLIYLIVKVVLSRKLNQYLPMIIMACASITFYLIGISYFVPF
jgi:hypothetical protein